MELIEQILSRASQTTAVRARVSGEDSWAIQLDDYQLCTNWILDGTLEVAVRTGIIKYDSAEAPYPDVIPDELINAIVHYLISEWFDSIGQIKEAVYWRNKFEEQLKKYRFNPSSPSTATRPYRILG